MSETPIPKDFSLAELLEEVRTIYREKRDFLETRRSKGKISPEFANLERFRLARLECLDRVLAAMVNEAPQPEPKPEPVQEPAPLDDHWDD